MSRVRAAAVLLAAALATAACTTSDKGVALSPPTDAPSASAPWDFTATTLAGSELDVATLRGQSVVLWFWAPWCTICRAEAPEVAKVAAELDGDVTFLGVPGRGKPEDMRSFVDATGTSSMEHLVDDDGSLWQRFGVVSQPSFVFVDPDGETELFGGALGAAELRKRASTLTAG